MRRVGLIAAFAVVLIVGPLPQASADEPVPPIAPPACHYSRLSFAESTYREVWLRTSRPRRAEKLGTGELTYCFGATEGQLQIGLSRLRSIDTEAAVGDAEYAQVIYVAEGVCENIAREARLIRCLRTTHPYPAPPPRVCA